MNLNFKVAISLFTLSLLLACKGNIENKANSQASKSQVSHSSSQASEIPLENDSNETLSFSSQVSDPCQYSGFSGIILPEVKRVFATDDTKFQKFQNEIENHPETALKDWLISTETFGQVKSTSDIAIQQLSNRGVGHAGIYQVHLVQHPERQYILKIGTHDEEAHKLWRLQNSIVGHPECFLRTDLGLNQVATPEDLAYFPKLAKIYEAAKFPFDISKQNTFFGNESNTHRYPILLERASGQALADLHLEPSDIFRVNRIVGKSLGYFHYFMAMSTSLPFDQWQTVTHGDLHKNNIFFDLNTNSVTFIDHESMAFGSKIAYDITQLTYRTFDYSINTGHSILAPYLDELQNQEAARKGMRLSFSWSNVPPDKLHPYDAIIGALENPEVIQQIPNSEVFQEISRRYSDFKAIAQGYVEAFPAIKQNEIRQYFGGFCRRTSDSFMRNYSLNDKGPIEPRLATAIRRLYPADFIACIDENRFE